MTVGTSSTTSSDVTLTESGKATLGLKPAREGSLVFIDIKDDLNNYTPFKQLGLHNSPLVIDGPCTFRVRRVDNGVSSGVYRG